jgi:acyl carrier protein
MNAGELMEKELVESSFRTFITAHFPATKRRSLRNNDSLLESGIIDSLGILDLVSFIESEFDVAVSDDDLTPDNFQTIDRMAEFVRMKKAGQV